MTNDRELLEAAAKAAGIEIRRCRLDIDWRKDMQLKGGVSWNPLTDDGDALRLAVKLGINLAQFPSEVRADAVKTNDYHVPHDADPYAATRRAIVLCAAALAPTP